MGMDDESSQGEKDQGLGGLERRPAVAQSTTTSRAADVSRQVLFNA